MELGKLKGLECKVAEHDVVDYALGVLLEDVKELDYEIVEMEQMQGLLFFP